jgi:serine/threonine-protein kinase
MAGPRITVTNSEGVLRFHHFEVLLTPEGEPWILGKGAAGLTYKAVDTTLRRNVALKVVDGRLLASANAKGRVVEEAQTAALLQHPNVAAIHYFGEEGDVCFYAMELVEGHSLEDYIREHGVLPPRHALDVAAQVAAALGAAHDLGIVHRDVKPANIMLSSGKGDLFAVKLVDFGLAVPLVVSRQLVSSFATEIFKLPPDVFKPVAMQ